jgi:S1-C subfamily serine protease
MPKPLSSFLSALIGGVIVAAVLLLTDIGDDGGGSTETIVEQTGAAPSNPQEGALSPRAIYKRDAPGVVFIRAHITEGGRSGDATGSGFVIGRGGSLVTNAHVVGNAKQVTVQFSDQKVATAKVAGVDPSTDLALLLVDPDGLDLHQLALGSSKKVVVGDAALAIGNPFGYERTLTTGVISGIGRTIPSLQENFDIGNALQTDAAINPGNSGGPLLDSLGRVIGVNAQIRTDGQSASNTGVGFAVAVDPLKEVTPRRRRDGRIDRAYLGVSTRTIDDSLESLDLPADSGALVVEVTDDSPADKAGIREGTRTATIGGDELAVGGDIIVAIDGKPVKTNSDVAALIGAKRPGDKVRIEVLRGDQKRTITVTLGKRPSSGA